MHIKYFRFSKKEKYIYYYKLLDIWIYELYIELYRIDEIDSNFRAYFIPPFFVDKISCNLLFDIVSYRDLSLHFFKMILKWHYMDFKVTTYFLA